MIIWWRACAFVAVVSAFVAGTVALLAPEAPRVSYETLLRVLCWVAGALMLGWAASHVRAVLDEQRVLAARVAPRGPRPLGPRASLALVGRSALALAVPVACLSMVLAASPGAATPGLLLAAAGAALATAGLLHGLAWIGLLAWWGRASPRWLLLACAPAALLAWGWDGVLRGFAQSPWLVPPACAAAAAAAMLAWRALWPPAPDVRASAATVPRARAAALARRLRSASSRVDRIELPFLVMAYVLLAPALGPSPGGESPLLVPWGSLFDPAGAARIALMAAVMALCLRMGALHWRLQLAPGRPFRHALGVSIVLRSWLAALAMIGMAGLAAAVLSKWLLLMADPVFVPALRQQALSELGGLALRCGPTLLCELLLATAVAAWLRPLMANGLAAALVCAALAGLVFAVAGLLAWSGHAALPGWPREAAHHLGVLVLAAGFTLLANGTWRRADLRRIAARQPGLGEAWRQVVATLRPGTRSVTQGRA
ncbi:MAG: hypothetical protein ACK5Y7_03025 [Betaproteobacteria bacterium]|jgi:hypothetical protein|nr:hypothetical protein [Rubrivivax sp.]